ncbi:large ribosomal subunit protein mL42 isoform X2 [Chrysemys picta bellii]|uniref:large ribosomal subunit protein mL42 isoform X2 n=1 Tax=Chrysemys picta bellii TaxID=8478 RepID=UPI0032B14A18
MAIALRRAVWSNTMWMHVATTFSRQASVQRNVLGISGQNPIDFDENRKTRTACFTGKSDCLVLQGKGISVVPPAAAYQRQYLNLHGEIVRSLEYKKNGAVHCARHKSTYSVLPEDYNCKVELAMTSDGRTIVCYHPSVEIPYEHTKPIPRPDPVDNKEETHDQVLKSRLEVKELKNSKGPTFEELSKMFYTTKHRWYPVGQYRLTRLLL